MKTFRRIAFVLLVAVMPACATTATTSSEMGQPEWVRYGTVTNIREVIQRREGDPAGGALAGAIIGGILGGGRGPRCPVWRDGRRGCGRGSKLRLL